jgi:hypothetical protein
VAVFSHDLHSADAVNIWLNAASYLPVRSSSAQPLGPGAPLISKFTWLAPTSANLAVFTPQIPAGFKNQQPQAEQMQGAGP